jgi:lipid-A-disaccharide synthase
MVIIYKLSPLTYQLAKRLIKVDKIGLCNIVVGETVVKELVQDQANPEEISAEIGRILSDSTYKTEIVGKLGAVRKKLEHGGASANVARIALDLSAPCNNKSAKGTAI